MAHTRSKNITLSALFISLGVLVPMLFHATGMGSIFLPMFWPVAISAFFLPFSYALLVGCLTPVLSSLLTGMPPISPPILYILIFELAGLSGTINLLYHRTKTGLFWPLLAGLIVSQTILYLFVTLLAPLLGLPPKIFSLAMVLKGLPGVAVMLIFIPFLIQQLNKEPVFGKNTNNV